ncbi:MAG: LacI family DNA-binding transcriptional regulator [Pricia sp.]
MKPKMTLKKIARELDVSISTVSKALHNDKNVSKETRKKIQAFAKFYNYRPDNIALSLKNRKTKNIGVIIPEIVHYFFAKVISGIEQVANERGYNVIIGVSNESFDKEVLNMEMLVNGGSIDGFIVSISKETFLREDFHHLKETISQGMPIVMFDRVVDEIDCDKVVVDDEDASFNAVQKLIDSGCRNIMLLTTKDYINIGRYRTEGYLKALKANDIELRPELIVKLEDKYKADEQQEYLKSEIDRFLDEIPLIDAIFGVNEIFAAIAMNAVCKRGLRVPEDVSVISFSDGVLSQNSRPSLTTISQHGEHLGEIAAQMLINKLEGNDEDAETFVTQVVKTELLERDSTLNSKR